MCAGAGGGQEPGTARQREESRLGPMHCLRGRHMLTAHDSDEHGRADGLGTVRGDVLCCTGAYPGPVTSERVRSDERLCAKNHA